MMTNNQDNREHTEMISISAHTLKNRLSSVMLAVYILEQHLDHTHPEDIARLKLHLNKLTEVVNAAQAKV